MKGRLTMSTEVFWNDAKPPRSEGEHVAAGWLAMIARQVGLTSVTEDNRSEWLWRFAFTQEMAGRRFGGKRGYERDTGLLEVVLNRFMTAALEGRNRRRSRASRCRDRGGSLRGDCVTPHRPRAAGPCKPGRAGCARGDVPLAGSRTKDERILT
jgi:hypothetical protein